MDVTVDVGQNATILAEKLANIIGVTVDKIFPWYVDQVFVSAICDLISILVFTLITLTTFIVCYRKADFGEPNRYGVFSVIVGVLLLSLLAIAFFGFSSIITQITNPEYYAVKNMMIQLSTLK